MITPTKKGIAALVSEAVELGARTIRQEQNAGDRIAVTAKLLNKMFRLIAKGAGGLRGQRNVERQGVDHVAKFGDVTVDIGNGAISRANVRANFSAFWEEVPGILKRHVDALTKDFNTAEVETEAAEESYWTCRAVIALVNAPLSGKEKDELMLRVLEDVELQQAIDAAQDTGEKGAETKLLSDQRIFDDEQ